MHPPASIPDHELLAPIGHGSYGEVWLARSVVDVQRAVKIVRRDAFADARPYEREFAAIQRYEPVSRSAEGLVHVLHVGRAADDSYFYYVMELADALDGADYAPRTLRAEIQRRGALPPEECVKSALALARSLAALHRAGLVHRDIKPSNIIFVNGAPKLADIGLVSESGESQSFVGTAGYIPPEGLGTPAADLYALGMVIYEMSTGHALARFPEVPREWLASGRAEMEFFEIVVRACESDSAQRYRSAEELCAELELLEGGASLRRRRAWEARRRVLRACALIFAGATLVAGAWWGGAAWREKRVTPVPAGSPAEPPVEVARAAMRAGHRAEALEALSAAARLKPGDDTLRTLMITALALPGETSDVRTARLMHAEAVAMRELRGVQFHPDGRLLAVAASDGVRLFACASGTQMAFLPQLRSIFAAFDSWGSALYASALREGDVSPGGLWRRPLREGPPGTLIVGKPEPIGPAVSFGRFSLSADARVLVASTGEPPVVIAYPRDGAPVRMEQSNGPRAPALTHDGRRAAASRQSRGGFAIWDTSSGAVVLAKTTPGECAVVFSPDGALLVTADETEFVCWRVADGGVVWRHRRDATLVIPGGLAWSEDGTQIAAIIAPSRVALLDAASGVVRSRFTPPGVPPVTALALSHDGSSLALACANGHVFLWHLRAVREALARAGLDWPAPPSPAFVPGGPVRVVVE